MIFGLGAALTWGLADFGAALVARRIGSVRTVFVTQLAGLVAVGLLALVVTPGWSGSWFDLGWLMLNGAIVAVAYLAHYRALELGPVALVSPLTSASAIVPVVLAVTLLGESMTAGATAGVLAIVLGTALITLDPRKLGEENRVTRAGIPYALVSLLLFGLATYIVGWAAQRVGWVQAVGLGRVFSVVAVIPIVLKVWPDERRPARAGRATAVAVGVLDVAGISIFSRGAEVGLVSIVASIAATFPLIPFVGGIVMLRERPVPSQVVGAVLVVAGLVGVAATQ